MDRENVRPPLRGGGEALRLPELQQAVLAVRGDEVLVGVVGDADHILLMNLKDGGATTRSDITSRRCKNDGCTDLHIKAP